MYKALITDLDGTAVKVASDGTDVDERTTKAIMSASRLGLYVSCATGRDWELAAPVIKRLGFSGMCIIEGGTRIVNALDGAVVWEKFFDTTTPAEVLKIFKAVPTEGLFMSSTYKHNPKINNVKRVSNRQRYMYLLNVDESVAIAMAKALNELPDVVAHLTPSWMGGLRYDIHATHSEASKEHAIKEWLKLVNIDKNEAIGMGDSGNDLPIFEAVGFKVAVSNATPEVLAQADYIAPAASDHALEHVIHKFLMRSNLEKLKANH